MSSTTASPADNTAEKTKQAEELMDIARQSANNVLEMATVAVKTVNGFISGESSDLAAINQAVGGWFVANRMHNSNCIALRSALVDIRDIGGQDVLVKKLDGEGNELYQTIVSAKNDLDDALTKLMTCPRYDKQTASSIIKDMMVGKEEMRKIVADAEAKNTNAKNNLSQDDSSDAMESSCEALFAKCEESSKLCQEAGASAIDAIKKLASGQVDDTVAEQATSRWDEAKTKHQADFQTFVNTINGLVDSGKMKRTPRLVDLSMRGTKMFQERIAADAELTETMVKVLSGTLDLQGDAEAQRYAQALEAETAKRRGMAGDAQAARDHATSRKQ